MNELSEQILEQIGKEAKEKAKKHKHNRVPSYVFGYEAGYNDGADNYALKWQHAEDMIGKLTEVLKEFISMHETGLLPNRFTYLKGKEALDEWEKGDAE